MADDMRDSVTKTFRLEDELSEDEERKKVNYVNNWLDRNDIYANNIIEAYDQINSVDGMQPLRATAWMYDRAYEMLSHMEDEARRDGHEEFADKLQDWLERMEELQDPDEIAFLVEQADGFGYEKKQRLQEIMREKRNPMRQAINKAFGGTDVTSEGKQEEDRAEGV